MKFTLTNVWDLFITIAAVLLIILSGIPLTKHNWTRNDWINT